MASNGLKLHPIEQDIKVNKSDFKRQMEEVKRDISNSKTAMKGLGDQSNDTGKKLGQLGNDFKDTSKQSKQLGSDLESTGKKTKGLNVDFDKVSNQMIETGGSMQQTGMKMSALSLPLVAIGKSAIDASTEFNSAFIGVKKTVDMTDEEFKVLERSIRDMALAIPASAEEIAGVAEQAGQLGIENKNIMDFTRTIIDLGVATNLTFEQGSVEMARFLNITRMGQDKISNLGSSLVYLGNNFATTESEIMSMSLRLSATGTQIGLTGDQIMAFSTGLSSVGVQAEAGGTAFSTLMATVQKAVLDGGESLEDFARVSKMSASEFKESFEKDASQALLSFFKGLGDAEYHGKSTLELMDELGIKGVRLRDVVGRAALASEDFEKALKGSNKAFNENTALTEEAEAAYGSFENQQKMTKQKIHETMIEIGNNLMPVFLQVVETVGDVVGAFSSLSPEMQSFIVKAGMGAVAIGPLTSGLGTIVKAGGKGIQMFMRLGSSLGATTTAIDPVASGFSLLAKGTATATGSTALLSGGFSGLVSSLGGVIATAAPYALAIGGVVAAGVALHKGLTQEVVPSVDLFADSVEYSNNLIIDSNGNVSGSFDKTTVQITEGTQERVGAFMEMSDQLSEANLQLIVGLTEGTASHMENMKQMNNDMTEYTITESAKIRDSTIADYQTMFENTTVLTAEQQAMIMTEVNSGHEQRIEKSKQLQTELNTIYDAIAKNSGKITEDQKNDINRIQEEQRNLSVQLLSDTEAEAKVIQNRMKDYGSRMSAEQAGEIVKSYNTMRDESLEKAEAMRDDQVRIAEQMRSENPEKFGQMADDVIAEANKMYEDTVKATEKTRVEGLMKLEDEYGELSKEVDLNTGEILSWWDKVKGKNSDWNNLKFENKTSTVTTEYKEIGVKPSMGSIGQVYTPKSNGLEYVPYDGYNARLHKGEAILTAEENEALRNGMGGSGLTINIENFENNREQNVEAFANELEFYRKSLSEGRGVRKHYG